MKTVQHFGYLVAFGVLAACTGPNASDAAASSGTASQETSGDYQKPGASISFTTLGGDEAAVSAVGHLAVSVAERYDTGTINVAVTGSEGLHIFQTSSDVTLQASGASSHDMTIQYRADADGKYYVNLIATAPNGEVRTHAIAVVVGELSEAAQKTSGDVQTDSEGNAVVVMGAEETNE